MTRRRRGSGLSVKSERLLERLGVRRALAEGWAVATVEPTYVCGDGERLRVAFRRSGDGLAVGYAAERGGRWEMEEEEPYSARALGYYQRRLKRIGVREGTVRDEDENG
jgi:hypothetical protein